MRQAQAQSESGGWTRLVSSSCPAIVGVESGCLPFWRTCVNYAHSHGFGQGKSLTGKSLAPERGRRILTTAPFSAFGTLPERGCPQPQHVRKGLGVVIIGQRCVFGAAAAE